MRLKETTKRRGQVLVFYALMIPIFLICSGVILDLGNKTVCKNLNKVA